MDGHGTVDSLHLCLSGYNEVILLKRLEEQEALEAVRILTGTETDERAKGSLAHQTLYGEPHQQERKEFHKWPTSEQIARCKEKQYAPIVLILCPGQLLHIGKGRLHAFRKLSSDRLPPGDCHEEARSKITGSVPAMQVSLAWDLMVSDWNESACVRGPCNASSKPSRFSLTPRTRLPNCRAEASPRGA